MGIPLRTLIIEDNEDDTLLVIRTLQKGGFDPAYERADTPVAMSEAMGRATWDIILCDYNMPHFNGLAALKLCHEKGLDIPFIIVSGTIGEEAAVSIMVSGAQDYVMKNNLSRLVPAVRRELRETESRKGRKRAEQARGGRERGRGKKKKKGKGGRERREEEREEKKGERRGGEKGEKGGGEREKGKRRRGGEGK